jgi:hypothetical protein
MELRATLRRLPLAGAAVAGAVAGHALAYVLTVPETGPRLALLAATGHAYWPAAIAAALVLGLVSLGATVTGRFRAGLRPGPARPAEPLSRLAVRLALLQIAIFLVQEVLERAAAGAPLATLLDARLLAAGMLVQILVAAVLATVLTLSGRAAQAAGRALRLRGRRRPATVRRPRPVVHARRSRLLAAGLGGRAPPA